MARVGTHSTIARRASPTGLLVAVFVGGALGALCRAGLQEWWPSGEGWPWGTFAANLAGTAILATVAFAFTAGNDPRRLWRGVLGTGFCGALTTFSAFQVEVIELARDGRAGTGIAYAAVSLVAGLGLAIGVSALLRRMRFG